MTAPATTSPSLKPSAVVLTLAVLGVLRLTSTTPPSTGTNLRARKEEKTLLTSRSGHGLGHSLLGDLKNKKNASQDGNNRVLLGTGGVSGSSVVTGIATGAGTAGSMNYGLVFLGGTLAESNGSGTGSISNSGGSQGVAVTDYGQAQGNSNAAASGASSGSGKTALLATPDVLINANSAGSVETAGDSVFSAIFNPNGAKDPTSAIGLGVGSVNVSGVSSGELLAVAADSRVYDGTTTATSTSAGMNAAGGSATASYGMGATAGGVGSGSTSGSVIEGGSLLPGFVTTGGRLNELTSNGVSTGAFDSVGQGSSSGQGGSAAGTSNGGGTASNGGSGTLGEISVADVFNLQVSGTATFASSAGSSGYVQSMMGSGVGSSAAGANGSTGGDGEIAGYAIFENTAFNVAGAVDSVGSGGFTAAFSPEATTPTGGSGSGNGSLNVVQSAAGNLDVYRLVEDAETSATTTGSANNFGSGTGVGSTVLGSAGSTGSGESSGSAVAGGIAGPVSGVAYIAPADAVLESFMSVGSATGDFDGAGVSFFGGSSLGLQFP